MRERERQSEREGEREREREGGMQWITRQDKDSGVADRQTRDEGSEM